MKYDKLESLDPEIQEQIKFECLTLTNLLINIPESLSVRSEIRNDFLEAGLLNVLEDLKKKTFSDQVRKQIQVFEDYTKDDNEELQKLIEKRAIKWDDPIDMMDALNENATAFPYLRRPFISTLKNLVLLPVDKNIGLKSWIIAEKLIAQIGLGKTEVDMSFLIQRPEAQNDKKKDRKSIFKKKVILHKLLSALGTENNQ